MQKLWQLLSVIDSQGRAGRERGEQEKAARGRNCRKTAEERREGGMWELTGEREEGGGETER